MASGGASVSQATRAPSSPNSARGALASCHNTNAPSAAFFTQNVDGEYYGLLMLVPGFDLRVGSRVLVAWSLAWLSHMVLDAMYNHGLGIGVFWPFSDAHLVLPLPSSSLLVMKGATQHNWKHGLRNTWWIIDYNRQSLDGTRTVGEAFEAMAARARRGGERSPEPGAVIALLARLHAEAMLSGEVPSETLEILQHFAPAASSECASAIAAIRPFAPSTAM